MKLKFSFATLALALTINLGAQTPGNQLSNNQPIHCGTQVPGDAWDQWFNQKVEEYKQSKLPRFAT